MTLYEKIDLACRRGLCPIIKKYGEYCIVWNQRDGHNFWLLSGFRESLDEAKIFICDNAGETETYWQKVEKEGAIMLDEYYTPPVEPYEEGEKVWYDGHVWVVDLVEKLDTTFKYYLQHLLNFGWSAHVIHNSLKPHFEETPTPPKEEDLVEKCKTSGKELVDAVKKMDESMQVVEDLINLHKEETLTERVARLEDELERIDSLICYRTELS